MLLNISEMLHHPPSKLLQYHTLVKKKKGEKLKIQQTKITETSIKLHFENEFGTIRLKQFNSKHEQFHMLFKIWALIKKTPA